jgi:energy-coupling factor transporter transmembrane protein EcfT
MTFYLIYILSTLHTIFFGGLILCFIAATATLIILSSLGIKLHKNFYKKVTKIYLVLFTVLLLGNIFIPDENTLQNMVKMEEFAK